MFKKLTVLAMAVGLVAALALPAGASAAWKHNNAPITQNVQLALTGTALFQSALGGAHCLVTSNVTFTAGQTTGHAESFVPDPPKTHTENCQGTGGLAFCEIHNVEATNTPWDFTTTGATTIQIHSGEIDSTTTGAFCPMEKLVVTPGTVTGTVDAHKVSSITLSGNIQVDAQTTGSSQRSPHKFDGQTDLLAAQAGGTLQIENPDLRATYEI